MKTSTREKAANPGACAWRRSDLKRQPGHLNSTAYRHALRLAVCVFLGDLAGRSYGLRRPTGCP